MSGCESKPDAKRERDSEGRSHQELPLIVTLTRRASRADLSQRERFDE
jgi:hypothetical protein